MELLEIFNWITFITSILLFIHLFIIDLQINIDFNVYKINKRIKSLQKGFYYLFIFSLLTTCLLFLTQSYISSIIWLIVSLLNSNKYLYYNKLYKDYYLN